MQPMELMEQEVLLMDSKIIACLGVDHYDIVHYLASVGKELGKSVLVVDLTERQSMMATIPTAGFGTISEEYGGIEFTNSKEVLAKQAKRFNYVFVYFGMDFKVIPNWVEEVYCVTDCQKHNIAAFEGLQLSDQQYRNLILRGSISTRAFKEYAIASLNHLHFNPEETVELPFTESDLEALLAVQYYSDYRFMRMSTELQEFIVRFFSVDFSEKEIATAIKNVSKRKGVKR